MEQVELLNQEIIESDTLHCCLEDQVLPAADFIIRSLFWTKYSQETFLLFCFVSRSWDFGGNS